MLLSMVPPDPFCLTTPDTFSIPPVAVRHQLDGQKGWVIRAAFWQQAVERHRKAERRRRRVIRALQRRHEAVGMA